MIENVWLYLDTFERVRNPLDLVRDVDASDSRLGHFYFRMPSWGEGRERFDDWGVLVTDYDRHHVRGIRGRRHVPINIAQYALDQYDRWLAAPAGRVRDGHRRRFLAQADWLLREQKQTAAGGVWQFDFRLGDQYQLDPPWISALAQGEAISVLGRAAQVLGDESYLDAARRAALPFGVPISRGGVRSSGPDGAVFYEECPTNPPHHILNGCLISLFGLLDLVRVTGDERARHWLDEGVRGVAAGLAHYDTGWWSRYSLAPRSNLSNHFRLAAPHYHCMHVVQLEALSRATANHYLRDVARRWLRYADNPLVTAAMNATYALFKNGTRARNQLRGRAQALALLKLAK